MNIYKPLVRSFVYVHVTKQDRIKGIVYTGVRKALLYRSRYQCLKDSVCRSWTTFPRGGNSETRDFRLHSDNQSNEIQRIPRCCFQEKNSKNVYIQYLDDDFFKTGTKLV